MLAFGKKPPGAFGFDSEIWSLVLAHPSPQLPQHVRRDQPCHIATKAQRYTQGFPVDDFSAPKKSEFRIKMRSKNAKMTRFLKKTSACNRTFRPQNYASDPTFSRPKAASANSSAHRPAFQRILSCSTRSCFRVVRKKSNARIQLLFIRPRRRLSTLGGTRPVTSPPKLNTSFSIRELTNE
jgi:hypothetical protein